MRGIAFSSSHPDLPQVCQLLPSQVTGTDNPFVSGDRSHAEANRERCTDGIEKCQGKPSVKI
jgi:hypothetical protein